jgi:hypothetical protein
LKELEESKQTIIETESKAKHHQRKTLHILRDYESQTRFLEKITKSKDLQKMVLFSANPQNDLFLSQELNNELLSRCASSRLFIEEHIGQLSPEFINSYKETPIYQIDHHIFDIIAPSHFSEKIDAVFERIRNLDDPNLHELFDLFYAQSIVTEVIQNYALELQTRILSLRNNRENYDNDNMQHKIQNMEKELKHKEKLLRRISKELKVQL